MNYLSLLRKKERYKAKKSFISEYTLLSFEQAFEMEYIHNSTAIEGNTLTLIETKVVLEDGIAIGGKSLREIYESVNHLKAYRYVKDCIAKNMQLEETAITDIHTMLMDNILVGGVYRNVDVSISGAQHTPPSPKEMFHQVKKFYADLAWKSRELSPVEFAAWTHAKFIKINPFPDGNGRTARLIMNYQLMANGFPAISIAKENNLEYFNALEAYAVDGNLTPFADMVAGLVDQQLDRYLSMNEPVEIITEDEEPSMNL